jgi:hypothetical protein
LSADSKAYVQAVWTHPWMREWRDAAATEPWTIAHYEDPDI